MALIDVINQVQLTLQQLEPRVALGFGSAQLSQRAQPPMVTWVPTTDSFEVGGEQHSGTSKSAARVIAMCVAGVEAHIWGAVNPQSAEDFSATWTLLAQVIGSLRANLKARDLVIQTGRWVDASGAEAVSYGRAYVLSFSVRLPITEQGVTGGVTTTTAVPGTTRAVYGDQPDWTQSTAFSAAAFCVANGNLYKASSGGTSASSGLGPSGTGSGIVDGSVTWAYVSTAVNQ